MTSIDENKSICFVCGLTFEEALASETSADHWTYHWGTATSTTIEAETCCDEHADEYEHARLWWSLITKID